MSDNTAGAATTSSMIAGHIPTGPVVVGIDNGGNCNNATVLDGTGTFLVDQLVEIPSRVLDGPQAAVTVQGCIGLSRAAGARRSSRR